MRPFFFLTLPVVVGSVRLELESFISTRQGSVALSNSFADFTFSWHSLVARTIELGSLSLLRKFLFVP